ncbi:hypothetical protein TDMWS_02910 [Thermodesulfomicrobium sp. WS]|uniref:hypothetical protein n=1 Tax=Thermodesulfomicrobium sp. WS TaxID=3004129 RepID=UPI0024904778|nr:hypothetical protein [Thermodesulfomicrobium sp. WS]BDV00206.1 hypothetical protein TDMWS_02910 [Thermodesulfomicrobium sp. WS]
MDRANAIRYLVDAQGNRQGVLIDEALWPYVERAVLAALERLCPQERVIPEPLADYELLQKNWDFRYPFCEAVECATCGAATENWRRDEPRKFMLRAANLGGLVAYQCLACKSRITRRHFKDKVSITCTPPCPER